MNKVRPGSDPWMSSQSFNPSLALKAHQLVELSEQWNARRDRYSVPKKGEERLEIEGWMQLWCRAGVAGVEGIC